MFLNFPPTNVSSTSTPPEILSSDLVRERFRLESESQPMKHEPSSLLRDSESAMDFVRGNTVLARDEHPESRKPLLQRDGRLFKDRPNFDGELATAVPAFPPFLGLQIVGIPAQVVAGSPAVRAVRSLRPAHEGDSINADLFVAKVLNRLL
jgi:hypothetical protein